MADHRDEAPFRIRAAQMDDRAAIQDLIAASARGLSRADYTDEQIEAALAEVFGVDSDLIRDGSYFVAERGGQIIGSGGWSRRATLFGGDQYAQRAPDLLDPRRDAAKVRAFFVHPGWARRGVGRALLRRCEEAAAAHGFRSLELMATLPGLKFYQALGFQPGEPATYLLRGQTPITFVPMRKALAEG